MKTHQPKDFSERPEQYDTDGHDKTYLFLTVAGWFWVAYFSAVAVLIYLVNL